MQPYKVLHVTIFIGNYDPQPPNIVPTGRWKHEAFKVKFCPGSPNISGQPSHSKYLHRALLNQACQVSKNWPKYHKENHKETP